MAFRSGGWKVLERFAKLLADNPAAVYHENRGKFMEGTLTDMTWQFPLGGGLGRWGQVYYNFGDKTKRGPATGFNGSPIWVEIQWTGWLVDGGIPLMLGYTAALAVAMLAVDRVMRTTQDRELSYWAAVIFALCVSVLIGTFGYQAFLSPMGLQFWALSAALYAADAQQWAAARRARRAGRGPAPRGATPGIAGGPR